MSRCQYTEAKIKDTFQKELEAISSNFDYREFWCLTETCVKNQVTETAQPMFKGMINVIPFTAKFFHRGKTIGWELRAAQQDNFLLFRRQAILMNFDRNISDPVYAALKSGDMKQLLS